MWNYNPTPKLMHTGVKGMRWGHRKLEKYQGKVRTQIRSSKGMADELTDSSNPKKWKEYWETEADSQKYRKSSLASLKREKQIGEIWLNTQKKMMKMTPSEARQAARLYKDTQKYIYSKYGVKVFA